MKKINIISTSIFVLMSLTLAGCNDNSSSSDGSTSTSTSENQGFDPSLISKGYTFYETWPENVIREYIGSGNYVIHQPDVTNGVYLLESNEDGYAPCLQVVVDGLQDESYFEALPETYKKWSESLYGIMNLYYAVDDTRTYEVDVSAHLDDNYEAAAPTYLYFYRVSDLFEDATLTTNTAWTADDLAAFTSIENISPIPFVKLGAQYEVTAVDSDDDGVNDCVSIVDYSVAWEALDEYGVDLLTDGYVYDGDNDYYVKKVESAPYLSQYVHFEWGTYGNSIEVGLTLSTLSEYPASYVNDFVKNQLESKYEIVAPSVSTLTDFTYYQETGDTPIAQFSAYTLSYTEFKAYSAAFETAGYEVVFEEQSDDTYGNFSAKKGYISFIAYFQNDFDDNYDYTDESGTLVATITKGEGYEDPGLYLKEYKANVGLTSTYQISPILHEISGTVTYVSSNDAVATVSTEGLVTPVAEGTATITVSVTYNEVVYSKDLVLTFVNQVTDNLTLAKLGVPIGTVYTDFSNIKDTSSAVYAGQCAGKDETIQLRSKNSNSGIYSSTSGGKIASVTATFSDDAANTGKVLNVYASNEPITSTSQLFQMTPVGTINGVAGESVTYEFSQEYAYVGVASSSGALYLSGISFVWAA